MNDFFQAFEFTHVYMNNILITKNLDWTDHVKMDLTINKLKEIGLKCNIKKLCFSQNKMEYVGL